MKCRQLNLEQRSTMHISSIYHNKLFRYVIMTILGLAVCLGLILIARAQVGNSEIGQKKIDLSQITGTQKKSRSKADKDAVRPFKVNIQEESLADLRRRLAATRWPDQETVADQSQGAQLTKLQELVRYWGTGYDWRKAEAKLNSYPQFITTIDGVDIHFIHFRSKEKNAMPLIITHGSTIWPTTLQSRARCWMAFSRERRLYDR